MTGEAVLRIGIIGLGRMGQNHLRVLSSLKTVDIGFIYDIDRGTSERLAASTGTAAPERLEDGLGTVEAVVIASPTSTHFDYVAAASKQVRNLFVEKPLSDTLESSAELARLAEERGLNLQVGFIERFNPAVVQMKKLLDRSTQVVSVDFVRTNKLSSRITDVDVVSDLMIHDIDLALFLNGPVGAISAHGVANDGMIDFATALLTHDNGRLSRIQASRITDKKFRTIQATCKDMFVDCELLRKEITLSRQTEVEQRPGEPYKIIAVQEAIEVQPQEALLTELQAFVAGCRGERGDGVPGISEGLEAMRICDHIQRAIRG